MSFKKWQPSKKAKREYAQKMNAIDEFCRENGIEQSRASDSYYFMINWQKYRVSNHTIEASNRAAFDEFYEQKRELYHPDGRDDDTIYITAGKTRIIEIYSDLKNGFSLDRRGYRK